MEIIDLLVRCGANIKIPDNSDESALDYATKYGHLDVVTFLSNYKAVENELNDHQETNEPQEPIVKRQKMN